MQATFSDPQGPRWIHAVLQVPAAVLVAAALFGGLSFAYIGFLLALAVIASSTLAMIPLRQRAPVPATLTLGPGYVKVNATKLRSPVIHAKDIVGASTARTDAGFALSLGRKGRDTPTTIVVPTEAEVDRLRLALGVGHGGHGTLSWWTAPTQAQRSAFSGRVVSTLSIISVLAAAAFASDGPFVALASVVAFFAVPVGLILSAVGSSRNVTFPDVEMTGAGIRLMTTTGPFLLPYAYYNGFVLERDHLVFEVPPPWGSVRVAAREPFRGSGVSDADVAILRAQLDGAALRARGFGRTKEEVAGRVEMLRRGRESMRDWLARLDMVGQTLSTGPGYRGQSLDAEDLWTVLEDPDAEGEMRMAAARVLRHVNDPKVRVRIDAAAAAIRDEHDNERVRVAAQESLEEAVHALDQLENRRARLMMR